MQRDESRPAVAKYHVFVVLGFLLATFRTFGKISLFRDHISLTNKQQRAMDTFVKEAKTRSTEKRLSDNLHKANSILSVFAILMTIALFVRIETKTKVIDWQIQQIKDVLKVEEVTQARVQEDVDITSGK